MLRVTVEIWPGGDKTRARAVAIANVANVSHLADVSDYAVSVTEGHNPVTNTPTWSQRGHRLSARSQNIGVGADRKGRNLGSRRSREDQAMIDREAAPNRRSEPAATVVRSREKTLKAPQHG